MIPKYRPKKNNPPKLIGSGSFSDVYLSHDSKGQPVALKQPRVSQSAAINKLNYESLIRETSIQKEIKQENIVAIIGCYLEQTLTNSFIVLEYANQGDLYSLIDLHGPSLVNHIKTIVIENMLDALSYLASSNIVHRDVKPENIMLDCHNGRYIARLGDFGFAQQLPSNTSELISEKTCGTMGYLAPESMVERRYSHLSDMYSFGVVIYLMMTLQMPYCAFQQTEVDLIVQARYLSQRLSGFSVREYLTACNFSKEKIAFLLATNLCFSVPNSLADDHRLMILHCMQISSDMRWTAQKLKASFPLAKAEEMVATSSVKLTSNETLLTNRVTDCHEDNTAIGSISVARNVSSLFNSRMNHPTALTAQNSVPKLGRVDNSPSEVAERRDLHRPQTPGCFIV
jgi:serine/threonine protein kinase